MAIDPLIARGYQGGIVNAFHEGERHRANMNDRDSINTRRNALVDIERQEAQRNQITAQQQQALLQKYSDIQALKKLPPEAAAQWLEQQKAEPNFANTPWANAPAEQAIPAIEQQIAALLGLKEEQPKQLGALYKVDQGGRPVYAPADQAQGMSPWQEPDRPPVPREPPRPTLTDVVLPDGRRQKQWVMPGASAGTPLGEPYKEDAPKPQTTGPQTESDRKATLLFGSIYGAERDIAKLKGGTDTSSVGDAVLGAIPLDADLAKGYQSQAYKKYESAAKRWSANLLYMKSGATATPEEVHSTYLQFFPQPREGQEVKDQKKAARMDEMRNISITFPWLADKYDLDALYKETSPPVAPGEPPRGKNPEVEAALHPKNGQRGKSKSGKPIIYRNGQWEYE